MSIPVFIQYDTVGNGLSGGANSFVNRFKHSLRDSSAINLVDEITEADVVLVMSAFYGVGGKYKEYMIRNVAAGRNLRHPLGLLSNKKSKKIVHRLDGLGRIYGRTDDMDDIQFMVNRYANVTVFQSNYCKKVFNESGICPTNYAIIGNGAAPEFFSPGPVREAGKIIKVLFCSWSTNMNKGFQEIVQWSKMKQVEVSLVGRWPENYDSGNVRLLGTMHQKELAQIFRNSDLLLFPSINDACPNVVYEALASGLPVIYHPSGGTPEICRDRMFGEPIGENPEEALERVMVRYQEIQAAIRDHYHEFLLTYSIEKYINVFKTASML